MRALIIPLLATATLVTASSAIGRRHDEPVEAKLQRRLAGLTPGKPTDCLSSTLRSANTETYGRTILFVYSRSNIYRSDTSGGCEAASHGDALITRTTVQLCRGDIAEVVDPVSRMHTGSCSFGPFVPYQR